MDFFKQLGKFGIAIAFLAYTMIFVQDSVNTKLIQDSINYNLIYSYDVEYNKKEGSNLLVLHIKNNGIKSLKNIRVKLSSNNNNISQFILVDTLNFIDNENNENYNKYIVLKKSILTSKNTLYPSESISSIFIIKYPKERRVKKCDFILTVNTELTNGIKVKNAKIDNEVNYTNIDLYIDATKKLIISILLKIILPIIILLLFLLFLFYLIKRTKIYGKVFAKKNDERK